MGRFEGEHEPRRWPWRPHRPAPRTCAGEETATLVDECEAFLLGRYAELLEERSEPVPVWAWTNVLAHGRRDDILRAAAGPKGGWSASRRWRIARAFVAREVMEALARGASLIDVQREVLAPLELELSGGRGVWAWTPQRWLETVRAALHSYRPSNRT